MLPNSHTHTYTHTHAHTIISLQGNPYFKVYFVQNPKNHNQLNLYTTDNKVSYYFQPDTYNTSIIAVAGTIPDYPFYFNGNPVQNMPVITDS